MDRHTAQRGRKMERQPVKVEGKSGEEAKGEGRFDVYEGGSKDEGVTE